AVDAWTMVAWLYGEAESGRVNGFEYRLAGDAQWTTVPQQDIASDGGSFHACIKHLSPGTEYEARAYSGNEYGETISFTTGAVSQIPNSDFDQWWLDGKVWNPWPEGGPQVWDTGNKGATTLGTSNSMPTEDTSSGTGWAAMLETRFVGIGSIGKLAAGNIFVGRYVRTDGTNGVLSLGYGFTDRPTKVKGYLKYKTAPISSTTAGYEDLKGRPDTCIVWCALIDQNEPLEIRTNPNNRQVFDPSADYVVAYGRVQFGEDVENYIPFEFELDYRSTSRVPRYILITASASKYGDYFTGGNGAVLYVDDLVLDYDY
ncbi:MAG: PCMD domain-containing protein, partial [Muribaculaceae bacterium]|nr:PCMD domain-containing protein [Muribaculaceae bacterium]